MAPGNKAWKGLGLPLYGEFEQVGETTANDQVTWTQKGGASGDLMVWRSSAGTEFAFINSAGDFQWNSELAGGGSQVTWDRSAGRMIYRYSTAANFAKLNLSEPGASKPTTGLVPGDIVVQRITSVDWRMGICSTGPSTVFYTRSFALPVGSAT